MQIKFCFIVTLQVTKICRNSTAGMVFEVVAKKIFVQFSICETLYFNMSLNFVDF